MIDRRNFIRSTGLLPVGWMISRVPGSDLFRHSGRSPLLDKRLDPAWVRSLHERGSVTTYLKSRNELQYIGMPAGGINCGTVYLGGDGRLWLWDIFNLNQEGVDPKTVDMNIVLPGVWRQQNIVRSRDGACYVEPAKDIRPLEQGFAIKIDVDGKTVIRQFRHEDWDEIAFEATYPMATIRYKSHDLPVEITLTAYSPFIPLDVENSGLPATILSFDIKNLSGSAMQIGLIGWLENKAGIYSAKKGEHKRYNKAFRENGLAAIEGQLRSIDPKSDPIAKKSDVGSLCIGSLHDRSAIYTQIKLPLTDDIFSTLPDSGSTDLPDSGRTDFPDARSTEADMDEPLIGAVVNSFIIQSGASATGNYVISWHFPNLNLDKRFHKLQGDGRYYATKFDSAIAVVRYVKTHFDYLSNTSKLWKNTWYDETTLPHWFAERTFLNISTLATTTCHRFTTGRFWAWEGVGSCEGTCTHVWQYAQAVGRIFPELERDTRQRVDLGIALMDNGGIRFRGELETRPAVDGQAGTILRIYREHQMCPDAAFLAHNWTNIKMAVDYLISLDKDHDGMEDTPVENTLDAMWDGEIAWIVGLCIAAVAAGRAMALEIGDEPFAEKCRSYVDKGRSNMEEKLFNGEYFIHLPDPVKGRKGLGSYNTCHIDQVLGQAWTFQVGLPRVLDKRKTISALRSLWKYNFTTDVGPYIKDHIGGRPYALPGEGGMIMNTNPSNEPRPFGDTAAWQIGYFNECMSGFEHQVAAHMMAEGMTDESLVLTRTVHDRYHAAKRNPFNEIECSDHYARAMASYGTFITACGFEFHGPKKYMRFSPKLSPGNFKAPFTTALGWGSYSQQRTPQKFTAMVEVRYGQLELKKLAVSLVEGHRPAKAVITVREQHRTCHFEQRGQDVAVIFPDAVLVKAGETIILNIR